MNTAVRNNETSYSGEYSPAKRPDSASTVDSQVKKRDRSEDVVQAFGLSGEEPLLDDFTCALKRSVLYQGRLYIYESHACFLSNLFGYEKLLVIPLKEVTQIRRSKYYGFPNSISFFWKGRKDTLTSFLKRDSAYKLLLYAWNRATPYARLWGADEEEPNKTSSSKDLKASFKKNLSKLMVRPHRTYQTSENSTHLSETSPETLGRKTHSETSQKSHLEKDWAEAGSVSDNVSHISDSDDESDTTREGWDRWIGTSEPAPEPQTGLQILVDAKFNLTVREFFKEFLSDQSQFFVTWHEAKGDTKVQLSEWHKHAVGYIRELTFITPLKQKIGPSQCLCNQTQKLRLHPGDHLLFETSQIMDIPYGDYFAVEERWDVTSCGIEPAQSQVVMRLGIPFSKKTVFRSTIESSTKALVKGACEDWVATARRWLEPPIPLQPLVPIPSAFAEPSDADGAQELVLDAPTHLNRSQSLAVRLSSNHLTDAELLLKAPSAHRSDIARVLQLRRLESEQKISRLQSNRRFPSTERKQKMASDRSDKTSREALSRKFLQPVPTRIIFLAALVMASFLLWMMIRSDYHTLYLENVWAVPKGPLPSDVLSQQMEAVQVRLTEVQDSLATLQSRIAIFDCCKP